MCYIAKGDRDVDNARMVRLLEKLEGYDFELNYIPGNLNILADILSRHPVKTELAEKVPLDIRVRMVKVGDKIIPSESLINMLEVASLDEEYKELVEAVAGRPTGDETLRADTARRLGEVRAGAEAQAGLSAFLERRKAPWIVEKE